MASKKTTSKNIRVELDFIRSTKNTHVFATEDEGAAVPTLYVRKSAFQGEPPKAITLTIA